MPRIEREPGDAGILRGARDPHVRHRRARAHARVRSIFDLAEAAAEPDHHARHAAVAHEQVEPRPITVTGMSAGSFARKYARSLVIGGHEQDLRRAADPEPGQIGQRLIGQQPAAQPASRPSSRRH